MKVYDTDEKAIAAGARKRLLARIIQGLIVLMMSLFGMWALYRAFGPKDRVGSEMLAPVVAQIQTADVQARDQALRIQAVSRPI